MAEQWTLGTWNVNSIKARKEHALEFLGSQRPTVIGLQELKGTDDAFPREAFEELGYAIETYGQKTYNGVALLSQEALADVTRSLPELEDDPQARVIAGRFDDVQIFDLYVPNGSSPESDKYEYKLDWLDRLATHLEENHDPAKPLALVGDFNIAPDERDIYDPIACADQVLFSEPERESLERLIEWGLVDVFRRFEQSGGIYSWWDYRQGAFRRNRGARIDLILVTRPLAERAVGCEILREPRTWEKPSDHAPVIATFRR